MGTSINGWTAPPVAGTLKTFAIPGSKRRVTLHKDAGRVLVALAADYHKLVRAIDVGTVDEGGYNYRQARASTGLSNHASGTAIDLNWSEEGNGKGNFAKTFWANAKHKAAIAIIRNRYGSVVQLGLDWSPRYWDPMHFEIKPGKKLPDVLALCKKLNIDVNGVRK